MIVLSPAKGLVALFKETSIPSIIFAILFFMPREFSVCSSSFLDVSTRLYPLQNKLRVADDVEMHDRFKMLVVQAILKMQLLFCSYYQTLLTIHLAFLRRIKKCL